MSAGGNRIKRNHRADGKKPQPSPRVRKDQAKGLPVGFSRRKARL